MEDTSNIEGKTALVTGGMGFIGSHLVEKLVQSGCRVKALGRYNSRGQVGWLQDSPHLPEVEVMLGDVRDTEFVRKSVAGCDYVFHLAALIGIPYSYSAPRSYFHTNVEGTLNVLEAVRELDGCKLIHTSTSEVYGSAQTVPISEKHPLQGQSPYSASKIGADKLVESFYRSFELPVVTVRPFNTYGPRQSTRAVIPTIITQCLEKGEVSLGSLDPTRDFNFVGDTVSGFIAASQSDKACGATVNLGSGKEISIGSLVKLIAELTGARLVIKQEEKRIRPKDSEVSRLLADNTLATQILDWSPRVSLREGLTRTIEWFRENKQYYRSDSYAV